MARQTISESRGARSSVRAAFARLVIASVSLAMIWWSGAAAQRPENLRTIGEARNFDARVGINQGFRVAPSAAQTSVVAALSRSLPDVAATYDEAFGVTRTLMNHSGYLTAAAPNRDPFDLALQFVGANLALLGLQPNDLADYEVTDLVPNPATGSTHIYLRQTYQGLSVYNAQLHVNVNRDGRILSVNNQFVPAIATTPRGVVPDLDATQAVASAAAHLGLGFSREPRVSGVSGRLDRQTTVEAPGVSREPVQARLMFLPIRRGLVRLVWNFQIHTPDSQHVYDMTVDAGSGAVWTRLDWVASDTYKAYPLPVESPNHTVPLPPADARETLLNPNGTASPFGWHDTNGITGAEFTNHRGNNVHAYDDINNDNLPPATEPDCSPSLTCVFGLDLTMEPNTYTSAAVTNLFYWNNIVHDVQYQYGFTEVAGNFQVNNYGRGGLGNDDVRAEAQDGSGLNNANFSTPPDGQRPRMQMYVWNLTTPNRDGDLDSGIVVHEYGHGISNRLVGGPSNVSCLGNLQQPGEGLSDWWALAYTAKFGDTATMGRGMGTYVLGQPTTGLGIRTKRYSTDPAINDWTYESISGMIIPHGVGSVWAQAAWEMYWALVTQYGFDPNLYDANGNAGNQRAMLYVNEGLQNTACSPTFTDVRDGIIQAVADNHGGADVCLVWRAFAGFGLGTNAVSGGNQTTSPTNGFGVPLACVLGGAPAVSISDTSVLEGNTGTRTATFTASLSKAGSLPVTVDYATADNTASSSTTSVTYANAAAITIPSSGTATPYPSTISVPTSPGLVSKVTVTLTDFSHTYPGDVDILLKGPGGQTVLLMSDVGENGFDSNNVTLIFDDAGPKMSEVVVNGRYKPTNNANLFGGDNFPAPAPAPPYGNALSVFNGLDPVGTWSLYVVDDFPGDQGSIAGGWSLSLSTPTGDYAAKAGTLTFAPGVTSQTVDVTIIGDTTHESNETFSVNLSNAANATIADGQGIGTIKDDDAIGRADLAIDFGASGLWALYNNTSYAQLHALSPEEMATGDLDGNGIADLILDFPGYGIWVWSNNASWFQLHASNAAAIVTGDLDGNGKSDVLVDFGAPGLWVYMNNSTWVQLQTTSPTKLAAGDLDGNGKDEAILNFTGFGVWVWENNTKLYQLHVSNAAAIVTGDLDGSGQDEVIFDFPGQGLWVRLNNTTWFQLHTADATVVTTGDIDGNGKEEAIISFPGFGVWAWMNNAGWTQLHTANPDLMTTGDLDGNRQSDVIMSFPGFGLWAFMNNSGYAQLHAANPQGIVSGNLDGN